MNPKMSQFILVGGIGRSGTSILAKTLASSKNSEFFYEPPVFMHFLENLNKLKTDSYDWKSFLNTLIFNDLMKGALSGRTLNLNRHDISSVYNYKEESEVSERFQESCRQKDLEELLKSSNGIIKVLDAIYNFEKLDSILPVFKAVIILRNPISVARSIQAKSWFSDESLGNKGAEPLRFMDRVDGFRYPLFLDKSEYGSWRSSTELERIAKYCHFHYQAFKLLTKNKNVTFIKYDDLVSSPNLTIRILYDKLNLEFGSKTSAILDSISLQSSLDEEFAMNYPNLRLGMASIDSYQELIASL